VAAARRGHAIYLLGTVHVLPEGFRWRSARIDAIAAEADELVLETERRGPPTPGWGASARRSGRWPSGRA
jgi:uncharacterized protein YbaP (TraB family)